MRGLVRNRTQAEEEESVFVTMTDMTISFLLIVMILLAFFATQLSSEDTVPRQQYERVRADLREALFEIERLKAEFAQRTEELQAANLTVARLEQDRERLESQVRALEVEIDRLKRLLEEVNPLEVYLEASRRQRDVILRRLEQGIKQAFPDLKDIVQVTDGTLRFQGEGLFAPRSSDLGGREKRIVETIRELLDEILICYTLGERALRGDSCDSGNAIIEAVQIEGHTDSDGSDAYNLGLSTQRANATFLVMLADERSILDHLNWLGQPVMSVSGYGEMRPIATNETGGGKAANRRIDLRIIMYAPSTVEEVEEIGRQLDALRTAGGAE